MKSDRIKTLYERLSSCDLCPRECAVDRLSGKLGCCRVGKNARVSSYGPHHGEEKPLRGFGGSGTIFFSGCNLNCVYCQNADISQKAVGIPVDSESLAEIMIELQNSGCHNINLVSPTHVASQIGQALDLAEQKGLTLPVVYNSGGYDSLDTLSCLEGLIDIYMPDMKYSNSEIGYQYSGVTDYPQINQAAVREMHRQVGDLQIDSRGIAVRGLMVRHLVLPDDQAGSRAVFHFLAREISPRTYLNIMDQYRPAYRGSQFPGLNRPITRQEFNLAVQMARDLGLSRFDRG